MGGSGDMKSLWHKILMGLLVCGFGYAGLYGAARWRKVLVMKETCVKERALQIRRIGIGEDCRDNWRGQVKNRMAPGLLKAFYPLVCLENSARGGESPMRFHH